MNTLQTKEIEKVIILVLQRFTERLIGVNIFITVHRISSIFCEAIYYGRGDLIQYMPSRLLLSKKALYRKLPNVNHCLFLKII